MSRRICHTVSDVASVAMDNRPPWETISVALIGLSIMVAGFHVSLVNAAIISAIALIITWAISTFMAVVAINADAARDNGDWRNPNQ